MFLDNFFFSTYTFSNIFKNDKNFFFFLNKQLVLRESGDTISLNLVLIKIVLFSKLFFGNFSCNLVLDKLKTKIEQTEKLIKT